MRVIESAPKPFDLNTDTYEPLIPGEALELKKRMESFESSFPKTIQVFSTILSKHQPAHPLLEDWLILPLYHFFWDKNLVALQWFEDLLNEVVQLIGHPGFIAWLEETIEQTKCLTTHAICDRLYDNLLQLYGGLYLARGGFSVEFVPKRNDEPRPDVFATCKGQSQVLECKFVHTSEKYESFLRRFNTAALKYANPRPRFLLCEQFILPSTLKIKSLAPSNCICIKAFLKKVYDNPNQPFIGSHKDEVFIYSTSLPSIPITIDTQKKFAYEQGIIFAKEYLTRLLSKASKQMQASEYAQAKKTLFIGFQPNFLYSTPWTEDAISDIKSELKAIASEKEIYVVFSEDVGFSVRNYT